MVLSRLELETYSYQKYTLPIKLKNQLPVATGGVVVHYIY